MTVSVHRLPSHVISMLFKTGKRVAAPSVLCLTAKSKDEYSRYAVHVSVKVQKSAVKRNRIKRIIRAALTEILPTLPHPIHCLIVVKKDCSMKRSGDMIKELEPLTLL